MIKINIGALLLMISCSILAIYIINVLIQKKETNGNSSHRQKRKNWFNVIKNKRRKIEKVTVTYTESLNNPCAEYNERGLLFDINEGEFMCFLECESDSLYHVYSKIQEANYDIDFGTFVSMGIMLLALEKRSCIIFDKECFTSNIIKDKILKNFYIRDKNE